MSQLQLHPWFVIALLLAPACTVTSSEEPPVADSAFAEVLVDLHLLEARAELDHDLPPSLRDSVLARHGLTAARFEAAIDFYVDHPQAYTDLYSDVLNRLNAESAMPYGMSPSSANESAGSETDN